MSEENSIEPGPPELTAPEHTLLPPPSSEGIAPHAAWMPPSPPPSGSVWHRVAAFVVLIAFVAAVAGAGIGFSLARAINSRQTAQTAQPETPIQAVTPSTGSSNGSSSADAIAAKVNPAIVDVNTVLGTGQAAGTGMIISSDGEILTNNHVVSGSTSITVVVQSRNKSYPAHVVGVDVAQDVAVIQIDSNVSGLPTVTIADSSSLRVGDAVVAIRNALGVANRIRSHEQASDLTYGQVGFLGVQVQSVDSFNASQLGLNVSSGALVTATPQSGTPAAAAGITRGSVITKLGGTAVTSAD